MCAHAHSHLQLFLCLHTALKPVVSYGEAHAGQAPRAGSSVLQQSASTDKVTPTFADSVLHPHDRVLVGNSQEGTEAPRGFTGDSVKTAPSKRTREPQGVHSHLPVLCACTGKAPRGGRHQKAELLEVAGGLCGEDERGLGGTKMLQVCSDGGTL